MPFAPTRKMTCYSLLGACALVLLLLGCDQQPNPPHQTKNASPVVQRPRQVASRPIVRRNPPIERKVVRHYDVLLKMMEHKSPKMRAAAARSLGEMGRSTTKVLQALEKALLKDKASVGYAAASAVGMLAERSLSALSLLRKALKLPIHSVVKFSVLEALGSLHPRQSASALPEILPLLRGKHADLLCGASKLLGSMGATASQAVPLLAHHLSHKQNFVVLCIAKAMGAIGATQPAAKKALVKALVHKDIEVRKAALRALGGLKYQARDVAPSMAKRLNDSDILVRVVAAQALARVASPQVSIVDALVKASFQQDREVRAYVALALGNTQSPDKRIASRLKALKQASEHLVKNAAVKALLVYYLWKKGKGGVGSQPASQPTK